MTATPIDENDMTRSVSGVHRTVSVKSPEFEDLTILQRIGMKRGEHVHRHPVHLSRTRCHLVGDAVLQDAPSKQAVPLLHPGTAEHVIEVGVGQQKRPGRPPALLELTLESGPLVRSRHAGVDDDGTFGAVVEDHGVFTCRGRRKALNASENMGRKFSQREQTAPRMRTLLKMLVTGMRKGSLGLMLTLLLASGLRAQFHNGLDMAFGQQRVNTARLTGNTSAATRSRSNSTKAGARWRNTPCSAC